MTIKVVLKSGHIILCTGDVDAYIASITKDPTVRLHDVSLYLNPNDPHPVRAMLMEVWTREIEAVSAD